VVYIFVDYKVSLSPSQDFCNRSYSYSWKRPFLREVESPHQRCAIAKMDECQFHNVQLANQQYISLQEEKAPVNYFFRVSRNGYSFRIFRILAIWIDHNDIHPPKKEKKKKKVATSLLQTSPKALLVDPLRSRYRQVLSKGECSRKSLSHTAT
jgi:hypothetical protein